MSSSQSGTPPPSPARGVNPSQSHGSPIRKLTVGEGALDPNETSTTIAIGNNTYTIVASKKKQQQVSGVPGGPSDHPSDSRPAAGSDLAEGATIASSSTGTNMAPITNNKTDPLSTTTNANGETIRIFRRSRTGPHPGHPGHPGSGSTNHQYSSLPSEDLPAPDQPAAAKEAQNKLNELLARLQTSDEPLSPQLLLQNLTYISEVVNHLNAKEDEPEDTLSELQSEAVPDEVRKWLASTFAKQEPPARRAGEERPSFKSVAVAIRTGIFIERIYRRMSSSNLMSIPKDVANFMKKGIDDWSFDTFGLNVVTKGAPLRYMGYELLTRHGCLHKYKIPPTVLESLLMKVEEGYANNGNPYHNNMHACDVLQTTHYFIAMTGLGNWLTDLEVFACLMSALIHDYDHNGVQNQYHVNTSTDLAILYNDKSVLENHHCSAFFKLISDGANGGTNIFTNMQKTDYREFRNLVIEMVLHTDMSQHASQYSAIKSMSNKQDFDKHKVLSWLVHSCDVSHPSKAWDLHHQWTSRCIEEFFIQGDKEAQLGFKEISPLCDRVNTNIPASQVGFIKFVVEPTLDLLGDVLDSILAQMHAANAGKATAAENGGVSGSVSGPKQSVSNGPKSSLAYEPINRPWRETLPANKEKWQEYDAKGERGILPPDDSWFVRSRPGSAKSAHSAHSAQSGGGGGRCASCGSCGTTNGNNSTTTNGSNFKSPLPTTQAPLLPAEGASAASTPHTTTLNDVIDEVPDSVISPPGSPNNWSFTEKDSSGALGAGPPRPNSAAAGLSPPAPRKVPISIDHKNRK